MSRFYYFYFLSCIAGGFKLFSSFFYFHLGVKTWRKTVTYIYILISITYILLLLRLHGPFSLTLACLLIAVHSLIYILFNQNTWEFWGRGPRYHKGWETLKHWWRQTDTDLILITLQSSLPSDWQPPPFLDESQNNLTLSHESPKVPHH
jgi:hypothetical protein